MTERVLNRKKGRGPGSTAIINRTRNDSDDVRPSGKGIGINLNIELKGM
jgi:hypothetical protein